MHKNQLQELAQRSCFNLPSYSCIREGPDHVPRFKATVNFNGETFESPTFCSTLRQAEHAAAEVALNTLAKKGPSRALAAKVLDETGVYKNLLQETAHRAGLNLPVYTTVLSGPSHVPVFACTVELAGMSFTGEPARTKKQAQKNAAMAAWSALKRLSQHGSSSTNSSSPSSETLGNEEQEQVIIARVLASLQTSGLKHSLQTDCQLGQQSSVPVCRDLTPPTSSVYPMHCEHWVYPSFPPGLAMYQMWQQEQLLQLQNHLLTIPVSPAPPPSPQILPYMQSIFCPDYSLFVPAREQNTLPAGPRLTIPTSGPSLYSNHSVSKCVKGRSTVTIQEIHEEQTEESSGLSPSVTTDPPVTGHANAEPRIEEPIQEDDRQKNVQLESKVENVRLEGNQTRQYECASHREMKPSSRPVDFHLQNQHGLGCSQPNLRPQYPPIASSNRSFRPPSAAAAPVIVRNMGSISSAGHRPQNVATCMPSPARMKTGIPSCSARPRPERTNLGGIRPNFMAPAVRIRSVLPVCSAPPPRKMPSAIQGGLVAEEEKKETVPEGFSAASSELDKLQL